MHTRIHRPERFTPDELDGYLAEGLVPHRPDADDVPIRAVRRDPSLRRLDPGATRVGPAREELEEAPPAERSAVPDHHRPPRAGRAARGSLRAVRRLGEGRPAGDAPPLPPRRRDVGRVPDAGDRDLGRRPARRPLPLRSRPEESAEPGRHLRPRPRAAQHRLLLAPPRDPPRAAARASTGTTPATCSRASRAWTTSSA